jgi:hypothetical protein
MDVHHFNYNHNIEKKTLPNKNLAKEPLFLKKPENLKIIFIEILSFHFWHRFHQFFFIKKRRFTEGVISGHGEPAPTLVLPLQF